MLPPGEAMGALPKVGESIGPYRIKGLLGTSGMGGVFLVEGGPSARQLALALLDDRLHGDQAARARFFGWARVLRGANHANVVAIVDIVEQGAQQYVVTELLRGRTLAELIKDGPLPLPRALHIAWQVSQALAAAHDLGVVHGGLKLASVFVTIQSGARDVVKVLDFMTDEPTAALAPEQQRSGVVDHRTDIYAFGAMLFELAAGRAPFVADTLAALKRAHLEQAPPAPSSLRPVPSTLDQLVQSCLAKDPDARPDMMREVQSSLREVALLLEHHRPEPAMDPTGDFALPAVGGWTVVPAPLVHHTRPAPIPGISGEGAPVEAPPAPIMQPLILDPSAGDAHDPTNIESDEELPTIDAAEASPVEDLEVPLVAPPPWATDALVEPSLGAADRSTDAAVLPRVALGIAEQVVPEQVAPVQVAPVLPATTPARGRRLALVAAGIAVAALAVVVLRFVLAPAEVELATPEAPPPAPVAPIAVETPPPPPSGEATAPAVVDAAPPAMLDPPPGSEAAPPVIEPKPPKAAVAKPAAKPKEPVRKPKPATATPPVPAKPAMPVESPKDEGTLKEGALVNPFKKKPK